MAYLSATQSLKPLSALKVLKRDATIPKYTIAAIYPGQKMCVLWQAGASREHDSFAGAILDGKKHGQAETLHVGSINKRIISVNEGGLVGKASERAAGPTVCPNSRCLQFFNSSMSHT